MQDVSNPPRLVQQVKPFPQSAPSSLSLARLCFAPRRPSASWCRPSRCLSVVALHPRPRPVRVPVRVPDPPSPHVFRMMLCGSTTPPHPLRPPSQIAPPLSTVTVHTSACDLPHSWRRPTRQYKYSGARSPFAGPTRNLQLFPRRSP